MYKNQLTSLPAYFDRYIHLVPDMDLAEALDQFGIDYISKEKESLLALGDRVYAMDKWTIRDICQHIIDTERIFAYRALRIARGDKTPLPGFDENSYAVTAHATNRSLEDIFAEFEQVRKSNLQLFLSFSDADVCQEGTASDNTISVLAIGFTMVGHVIHHMNIIKERYLPLLEK